VKSEGEGEAEPKIEAIAEDDVGIEGDVIGLDGGAGYEEIRMKVDD
jgi:hypothetical protein